MDWGSFAWGMITGWSILLSIALYCGKKGGK